MVLGAYIVEQNIVVESSPYSVGTGSEEYVQMEEWG